MGCEVLEGLCVSQSQQHPLSRKINKRIIAHHVTHSMGVATLGEEGGLKLPFLSESSHIFECVVVYPL